MATILSPQLRPSSRADSVSWLSNGHYPDYQTSQDVKVSAPGYPPLVIRIESVHASPTSTPTVSNGGTLDSQLVSDTKASLLSSSYVSAATRLRNMIEKGDKLIVCPGVYDGFSARIAMSLGFDALYMVYFAPLLLTQPQANKSRLEQERQRPDLAWLILALPSYTT